MSRERDFYFHNQNSTLMRTNKNESKGLGKLFAEKVNKAKGPTVIAIPLKGWSILDTKDKYSTVKYDGTPTGRKWYNAEANQVFVESFEENIDNTKDNIELIKFDFHINATEFAVITTSILDDMINSRWKKGKKY